MEISKFRDILPLITRHLPLTARVHLRHTCSAFFRWIAPLTDRERLEYLLPKYKGKIWDAEQKLMTLRAAVKSMELTECDLLIAEDGTRKRCQSCERRIAYYSCVNCKRDLCFDCVEEREDSCDLMHFYCSNYSCYMGCYFGGEGYW